jgi:predicted dehydrogenase
MYSNLNICIIGNGIHSKRIQNILNTKKIKFLIYKPKSKINYAKKNLNELKKFNTFFITSPDNTHYHYINKLYRFGYIFCEKPPCTNKKQLVLLKKIKSRKIFYNFNYRFSKFYKILKNKNKYNLGKLLYGTIINGHALGLKKDYKKNWRSKQKISKKGILEVVSIHYLDIINCIFKIKNIEYLKLNNYSKYGNSYDNAHTTLTTKENSVISIFNSWTSELIQKIIFVFKNGSIEKNENFIIIKGPALNLDKNNFTKSPKIKEKINLNSKNLNDNSLLKSVEYFLGISSKRKNFKKEEITTSLKSNYFVI